MKTEEGKGQNKMEEADIKIKEERTRGTKDGRTEWKERVTEK